MATENLTPSQVSEINAQFVDRFERDSDNFRSKTASALANIVQDHIREDGFRDKFLPTVSVGRQDLQVSVNHDTLVKIVETEPRTRAATMSFRGQPDVVYFTAPRFEVGFYEIGSPRYEQTKQEILAYSYPITEWVRKTIVTDIAAIEDRILVTYSEQAATSLQQHSQSLTVGAAYADNTAFTAYNILNNSVPEIGKVKSVDALQNSTAANAAAGLAESTVYPLQKDDIIKLRKLFPGYGGSSGTSYGRLRLDKLLITETDEADLASWTMTEVGSEIAGQTAIDGWKGNKVVGASYVRTLKTDILRPGNVYAYAPQNFLGQWMVLNKLEFWADKERNRFSFEAYQDCGSYIGNVAGVRKLELYAGTAENTSTANTAMQLRFAPLSEKEIGRLNNLVKEGVTVPKIADF